MERRPDPERQRLGRLGALTVHARGRTNTRPARAAWEAGLAAEFGITDEIGAAERKRRLDAALRERMTRLAMSRWAKKKAAPLVAKRDAAEEPGDAAAQPRRAA